MGLGFVCRLISV